MIILLNGCSSAGKSTLARAIQFLSEKPYLLIGIDTFFHMLPPSYVGFGDKADQGFHFIPEHDDLGPLMRIENGPYGKALGKTIPKVIQTIAIISDAPKISFLTRPPTSAEEQSILIPMEEDLYAPLLMGATWLKPKGLTS